MTRQAEVRAEISPGPSTGQDAPELNEHDDEPGVRAALSTWVDNGKTPNVEKAVEQDSPPHNPAAEQVVLGTLSLAT